MKGEDMQPDISLLDLFTAEELRDANLEIHYETWFPNMTSDDQKLRLPKRIDES